MPEKNSKKGYVCVHCHAEYYESNPVKNIGDECRCSTVIKKEGLEMIHILNTVQDCTVMDLPDVISAIRKDVIKRYSK